MEVSNSVAALSSALLCARLLGAGSLWDGSQEQGVGFWQFWDGGYEEEADDDDYDIRVEDRPIWRDGAFFGEFGELAACCWLLCIL